MKLATSTGDFKWYGNSTAEELLFFKDSKFKYINLDQSAKCAEFFSDNDDDWKRLADSWGNAAAEAGVKFAVAHAPCLHQPCMNMLHDPSDESYRVNLRAIRRSVEICHRLAIPRIVVHACPSESFTEREFYAYNGKFYSDLFDLMEKYSIVVMTENWDNAATQFSTGKQLRSFIEYMDHPLLAACWDTAHGNIDAVAREVGQYQNIVDLGEKLKGVHISDNFGDCHHHTWPFAGIINFDAIMQGLCDVNYDGYFTFEAAYTLLHQRNIPYHRKAWEYRGETVTKLLSPSVELKKQAVDLLYETGKHILTVYDCFEE